MASRARKLRPGPTATQSPEAAGVSLFTVFALAIVTTLILYAAAARGQFLFDDIHLPFANPNAGNMPWRFWIGGVRPVLIATYWANFLVFGTAPLAYHLVNSVIHAANATLIFQIASLLLKGNRPAVYFATALFLVHPLQAESVAYIAGRSELLSGTFVLAAWLVFLKADTAAISLRRGIAILALWGLALGAKESAISLPLIFFVTDLARARNFREGSRLHLRFFAVLATLGAIAAIGIVTALSAHPLTGFGTRGTSPAFYLLSQMRAVLIYVRLFLAPVGQNGDWGIRAFNSLLDRGAFLYALAVLALGFAALRFQRDNHVWRLGFLFFAVSLAPASSIVPLPDILAERRLYLPIFGLILMLVSVVPYNSRALLLTVVAVLSILTGLRAGVWANRLTFWFNATQGNPGNARARIGYGTALLERGQPRPALEQFEAARRLDPASVLALANIASAHQALADWKAARADLQQLAQLRPTAENFTLLGSVAARLSDVDQATLALGKAIEIDPNYAPAYGYLAAIEVAKNQIPEARADIGRALALDPNDAVALYARGLLPK